jgi:hypothetical protein
LILNIAKKNGGLSSLLLTQANRGLKRRKVNDGSAQEQRENFQIQQVIKSEPKPLQNDLANPPDLINPFLMPEVPSQPQTKKRTFATFMN